MLYQQDDLDQMDRNYRANFINSLGGFKSVVLIGTKSQEGNENLAIFSSFFHLGANPALCGIIVRPNEEKENTLGNIVATQSFTINHIHPDIVKQAHQCSAKYDSGVNEFAEVGLHSEYQKDVYAPFVKESSIKFACTLEQKIDISINGTFLIIGRIKSIVVPTQFQHSDGFIDLEKAQTITCSGLDSYHTTQSIARLRYAKVGLPVKEI